jgi:hypothetical protein
MYAFKCFRKGKASIQQAVTPASVQRTKINDFVEERWKRVQRITERKDAE